MFLEVVGTRVVGPFFGVGLYVWSALITVTLLSLAVGYWVGGKLADARRDPAPLYLIILGAAALTFLIPPLRTPVLSAAGELGFRAGALAGSALLFGPALFLLGMVTPYATKLYTERLDKLGASVGLLYSVSTLGSFLGTLTMGFYLIPTFRLTTILLSLGFALLLLPLVFFLLLRERKAAAFAALLVLGVGLLVYYPRAPEAGITAGGFTVLHKSTSFYGELKVIETAGGRILLLDGVSQSGEMRGTGSRYPPYVQDLGDLLQHFTPEAKRVLVIGLGGGNLIHVFLDQGRQVDVVEIDPHMVTVAERYFGVDPQKVRITLEDGRRYVRGTGERYDAIVMNAFSGENSPTHLLSREFFQETKRILNPGGIMLVNFVGYVQGPHRWGGAAVQATLGAAYGWCRTFFRDAPDRFGNILYAAGDGPAADETSTDAAWTGVRDTEAKIHGWETAAVCTDEYNPIDFLNRVAYRRWRELIISNYSADVLLD